LAETGFIGLEERERERERGGGEILTIVFALL